MNPDSTADYLVEPLADRHDRSQFCSGVEALDRYLRTQAGQDARRRVASPYVLVHLPDAFYQKFGFLPILGQPRRLFLPMKTIAKLFPT